MKAKLIQGRGFGPLLKYLLGTPTKMREGAEIVGGNMMGLTWEDLRAEFEDIRNLRADIVKPVIHISLSLVPGEELPHGVSPHEIGEAFLRDLDVDVDKHQWVVVLHRDKKHLHFHIALNKIADDTKVWDRSNYVNKALASTPRLEAKFGLVATKAYERPAEVRAPGRGELAIAANAVDGLSPKTRLQAAIPLALAGRPTPALFEARLAEVGISARLNRAENGKASGYSFSAGALAFKGSQLGKSFGWAALAKKINLDPSRQSVEGLHYALGVRGSDVNTVSKAYGLPGFLWDARAGEFFLRAGAAMPAPVAGLNAATALAARQLPSGVYGHAYLMDLSPLPPASLWLDYAKKILREPGKDVAALDREQQRARQEIEAGPDLGGALAQGNSVKDVLTVESKVASDRAMKATLMNAMQRFGRTLTLSGASDDELAQAARVGAIIPGVRFADPAIDRERKRWLPDDDDDWAFEPDRTEPSESDAGDALELHSPRPASLQDVPPRPLDRVRDGPSPAEVRAGGIDQGPHRGAIRRSVLYDVPEDDVAERRRDERRQDDPVLRRQGNGGTAVDAIARASGERAGAGEGSDSSTLPGPVGTGPLAQQQPVPPTVPSAATIAGPRVEAEIDDTVIAENPGPLRPIHDRGWPDDTGLTLVGAPAGRVIDVWRGEWVVQTQSEVVFSSRAANSIALCRGLKAATAAYGTSLSIRNFDDRTLDRAIEVIARTKSLGRVTLDRPEHQSRLDEARARLDKSRRDLEAKRAERAADAARAAEASQIQVRAAWLRAVAKDERLKRKAAAVGRAQRERRALEAAHREQETAIDRAWEIQATAALSMRAAIKTLQSSIGAERAALEADSKRRSLDRNALGDAVELARVGVKRGIDDTSGRPWPSSKELADKLAELREIAESSDADLSQSRDFNIAHPDLTLRAAALRAQYDEIQKVAKGLFGRGKAARLEAERAPVSEQYQIDLEAARDDFRASARSRAEPIERELDQRQGAELRLATARRALANFDEQAATPAQALAANMDADRRDAERVTEIARLKPLLERETERLAAWTKIAETQGLQAAQAYLADRDAEKAAAAAAQIAYNEARAALMRKAEWREVLVPIPMTPPRVAESDETRRPAPDAISTSMPMPLKRLPDPPAEIRTIHPAPTTWEQPRGQEPVDRPPETLEQRLRHQTQYVSFVDVAARASHTNDREEKAILKTIFSEKHPERKTLEQYLGRSRGR